MSSCYLKKCESKRLTLSADPMLSAFRLACEIGTSCPAPALLAHALALHTVPMSAAVLRLAQPLMNTQHSGYRPRAAPLLICTEGKNIVIKSTNSPHCCLYVYFCCCFYTPQVWRVIGQGSIQDISGRAASIQIDSVNDFLIFQKLCHLPEVHSAKTVVDVTHVNQTERTKLY